MAIFAHCEWNAAAAAFLSTTLYTGQKAPK